MKHLPLHLIGFALAAAFGATTAHADVYTVGTPSGPGQSCTHGTIQSAINAANSHAGPDTIRLTRSLTYAPEANTINTAQELTIEGGYATCAQATPDNTRTVVSGAGGAHAPVFTITAPTGALIHLRWLEISGGDVEAAGQGGGIRFDGDGVLDISDSLITQNTAGYGGGIYAHGTHSNAELAIGANVVISNNTALHDGGGIYSSEMETSLVDPGSVLLLNHADNGYGGGLYIHAGDRHSYAYVGSGQPGIGAIWGNTAKYGGGVAIGGQSTNGDDHSYAELQLFTTNPAYPARLAGNSATAQGGAIYAKSFVGSFDGRVYATVRVWNANIEDNIAPEGAVALLAGDTPTIGYDNAAYFYFNTDTPPPGAVPCAVGADCGRISGNATKDSSGNLTEGAIFRGTTSSLVEIGSLSSSSSPPRGGTVISGNKGGRLYYDGGDGGAFGSANALITGNQLSRELVRVSNSLLFVRDSTIAGNTIGAGNLFASFDVDVEIQRSLLWQPGLVMLDRHDGTLAVDHTMANEITSLGGNFGGCDSGAACAILADPEFVDPAHGDYSLRVSSPAIDMAPAISGDDRDLYGNPRDYNLPHTWADNGPRDLGAFERQSLQPMVLNGNFDPHDLRLWTVFSGEWNGAENAVGGTGSGAWRLQKDVTPPIGGMHAASVAAGSFDAGEQCIRLPGPGRYLLNGWGKAAGNFAFHDSAVLAWEYRKNSTFDCGGTVDASGELTLSTSSSWARPTHPAVIDSTDADFYASNPTIKLRLIGRSGFPAGLMTVWFDGITLDVTEFDDVIFANGFD